MVDPESLRHGLHGFASAFEHQPLEVETAGGALVLANQRGKDLGNEIPQVIWGVEGGFRVHNRTLRRCGPIHKS